MFRNVRDIAAGMLAALFVCCALQAPARAETWPDGLAAFDVITYTPWEPKQLTSAEQRMQHLGGRGPHPLPLTGGKNDDGTAHAALHCSQ